MYYEPQNETSGLPHSPWTAFCTPRPIGWISTVSAAGVHNIAPFANFQNVTFDPPTVLFAVCGNPKDTLSNALETGEFVWNMATYALRSEVARSAIPYPPEVDEFEAAGIEHLPSTIVRPRRVAGSPVHFECQVRQTLHVEGRVPEADTTVVVGEVVAIHVDDAMITDDGRVDVLRMQPLARLGYLDYTTVDRVFEVEPQLHVLHHNREVRHAG